MYKFVETVLLKSPNVSARLNGTIGFIKKEEVFVVFLQFSYAVI